MRHGHRNKAGYDIYSTDPVSTAVDRILDRSYNCGTESIYCVIHCCCRQFLAQVIAILRADISGGMDAHRTPT